MNVSHVVYARMEFVHKEPEIAIPLIIIICLATLGGTLGNILILVAVGTRKVLQDVEAIFIVNLACSDLCVTILADPMSIVAKLEGIQFFDSIPGLCRAIGSLCTISCVSSLLTIGAMSFNRYVFIVHHHHYKTIFTPMNCGIMCVGFYGVGLTLVLLNLADIGGHNFDRKSLVCIWERMATFDYTIVFSVVMVWVPIIVVGVSYLHMYLHVRAVRGRVYNNARANASTKSGRPPSFKLAKTLFLIYMVISVCWVPYGIMIVSDVQDTISTETYLIIVVFAHLHPSMNWIVYYFTNRKFNTAFNEILHISKCFPDRFGGEGTSQASSAVSASTAKEKKTVKTAQTLSPATALTAATAVPTVAASMPSVSG